MGKKGGGKKKGDKGKGGDAGGKKRDVELNAAINYSELVKNKLAATEKSRNDYRESCQKVSYENEKLHDTLYQAERDTIEVITYLKKEDLLKDEHILHLQQQLRDVKQENKAEKQQMIADFTQQIAELELDLDRKSKEVKLMRNELTMVNEFRVQRAKMQSELDNIKESLFDTNREHKTSLQRMEQKFLDEKLRLEQEATKKLADLAERAHDEAIAKLDDSTRNVFKENACLNESLSIHKRETEKLQKELKELTAEAETLRSEKETNSATVRKRIVESNRDRREAGILREKVVQLETAISNMIHDFQNERSQMEEKMKTEVGTSIEEIDRLQKMLRMKDRDANRVKILARNIIDERSELETFFHEALQQVRTQINRNRTQYVAVAKAAYNQRMVAAAHGQGEFPKVRTFGKNEMSTNSVMEELKAAENTSNLEGKKDIRDFTWEQKEKVLRLLFAKINRVRGKQQQHDNQLQLQQQNLLTNQHQSEKIAMKIRKESLEDQTSTTTFLTQQDSIATTASSNIVLPAIGLNS